LKVVVVVVVVVVVMKEMGKVTMYNRNVMVRWGVLLKVLF
jgi:hypothetical protein